MFPAAWGHVRREAAQRETSRSDSAISGPALINFSPEAILREDARPNWITSQPDTPACVLSRGAGTCAQGVLHRAGCDKGPFMAEIYEASICVLPLEPLFLTCGASRKAAAAKEAANFDVSAQVCDQIDAYQVWIMRLQEACNFSWYKAGSFLNRCRGGKKMRQESQVFGSPLKTVFRESDLLARDIYRIAVEPWHTCDSACSISGYPLALIWNCECKPGLKFIWF